MVYPVVPCTVQYLDTVFRGEEKRREEYFEIRILKCFVGPVEKNGIHSPEISSESLSKLN
jgi:hypothetical protein